MTDEEKAIKKAWKDLAELEKTASESIVSTSDINSSEAMLKGFLDRLFPTRNVVASFKLIAEDWARRSAYLSDVLSRMGNQDAAQYAADLKKDIENRASGLVFVSSRQTQHEENTKH